MRANETTDTTRRCGRCGNIKPHSEFGRAARNHVGLSSICRPCGRARTLAYRRANKERVNARNRAYYRRHKDRHRATQKKYIARKLEWMRTDKVRHAKALLAAVRQRARKLGLPFNIDHTDIPVPDRCPALGVELKRNRGKVAFDSATVDRIVPARGYVKGNVIVISQRANAVKNDATPDEIYRVWSFYKRLMDDR